MSSLSALLCLLLVSGHGSSESGMAGTMIATDMDDVASQAFALPEIPAIRVPTVDLSATSSQAEAALLSFIPIAGTIGGDIYVSNYVDLDPAGGLLDWDCSEWTYDGHDAYDLAIRTWAEQDIGIPVFAARDGTVTAAHDGEFDRNTTKANQPANYVVIDHGDGYVTHYWHFRKGSVIVRPGQSVVAGEQIGLAGSSGISTGPHLHFAAYRNGRPIEPSAGVCRQGPSFWVHQPPVVRDACVLDFGLAGQRLTDYKYPSVFPRISRITSENPEIIVWAMINNVPPKSVLRTMILDPHGNKTNDWSTTSTNDELWRWSWWSFWTANRVTSATKGTWRFILYLNEKQLMDAPMTIEPASGRFPPANRPPELISLSFEPELPTPDDVVVCRIGSSSVVDDLDYDVVRYEYVWTVNGVTVREATSAARSDVIRRRLVREGDLLRCVVTPDDGKASGPSAETSIVVSCEGRLWADLNNDCRVDARDLAVMAETWLEDGASGSKPVGTE